MKISKIRFSEKVTLRNLVISSFVGALCFFIPKYLVVSCLSSTYQEILIEASLGFIGFLLTLLVSMLFQQSRLHRVFGTIFEDTDQFPSFQQRFHVEAIWKSNATDQSQQTLVNDLRSTGARIHFSEYMKLLKSGIQFTKKYVGISCLNPSELWTKYNDFFVLQEEHWPVWKLKYFGFLLRRELVRIVIRTSDEIKKDISEKRNYVIALVDWHKKYGAKLFWLDSAHYESFQTNQRLRIKDFGSGDGCWFCGFKDKDSNDMCHTFYVEGANFEQYRTFVSTLKKNKLLRRIQGINDWEKYVGTSYSAKRTIK